MMKLLIADDRPPLIFEDDVLAITIIKSPCPIHRVEKYDGVWIDITNQFDQFIKKGKSIMRKINLLPAFAVGEVIDLSYKHGGMPNRIYINSVFWRDQDTKWNYEVTMENNGERAVMSESFIMDRKSKNTSPVCKNPEIIKRFADGWRFCGNFSKESAMPNAKMIAENANIENVRLYPALNYRNQFLPDKLGIWVKYKHTINNDGSIYNQCMMKEFVDVK